MAVQLPVFTTQNEPPQPVQTDPGCGCGPEREARVASDPFLQPFVCGAIDTPAGQVPQVRTELSRCDRWGTVKMRLAIGRMDYRVEPGLYAAGNPGSDAPVLVSANYKLSFDTLRSAIPGLDAWILVLDTLGINVWCAAGKGTFGTDELARRIGESRLAEVVSHRKLIVPQLGAPGVAGYRVTKATRFKVVWGPIRAADIPAFLAAGGRATPAMRRKDFPLCERMVLIPVELAMTLKPLAVILPVVLLLGGLAGLVAGGGFWSGVLGPGVTGFLAVLGGVFAGVMLMPLLLPWLPGRAFSAKGVWAGLVVVAAVVFLRSGFSAWPERLESVAWLLIATALAAFLAMNFTGASTFTSLSGVKREMRAWVPLQITAAVLGLGLWIAGLWIA